MANKSIHITTHGDDWQVKTTRNTKATKVCTTQKECIDYGKKQAQRHGQIRKKNSYGNDPRNIKG
jgi:hypothetical protein